MLPASAETRSRFAGRLNVTRLPLDPGHSSLFPLPWALQAATLAHSPALRLPMPTITRLPLLPLTESGRAAVGQAMREAGLL